METTLSIKNNGKELILEALIGVAIKKKERNWIVYSPQFKTFGSSPVSEDAAKEDFREALRTFFKVHLDRNTLESALQEFGWEREEGKYMKPKYFNTPAKEKTEEIIIDIND